MQIRKMAGAIDGSLQCIYRRLLAISASKKVESFYRAVQWATKVLQGTSQNRILGFKSTRRMPGAEVLGTPLKKWLERNVVWQSTYHIRAKVNINPYQTSCIFKLILNCFESILTI